MGVAVVALAVTVILLSCCIIYLFYSLNKQTNGELKDTKRYLNGLEIVIQHKFQCVESEQQVILEKLEYHIMNHNHN